MIQRAGFSIGGAVVAPGARQVVRLPIAATPVGITKQQLEVMVVNGRREGPAVFVSAAVHGDEINGVQIVREVAPRLDPASIAGTVLLIPVVNVFGFAVGTRTLPDGRDLNRSFPGSRRGSLAGQLARLFLDEILDRCSVGVDLHSGSTHRTNSPQVRGDLDHPEVRRLALAFGAPTMIHAKLRKGSMRQVANARGKPVLVFEGGEAHRFDSTVTRAGVDGVMRVLAVLDMIDPVPPGAPVVEIRSSRWVRAARSGVLRLQAALGQPVKKGQVLAHISDVFGRKPATVKASIDGVVIGQIRRPIVYRGDALFHLGTSVRSRSGVAD